MVASLAGLRLMRREFGTWLLTHHEEAHLGNTCVPRCFHHFHLLAPGSWFKGVVWVNGANGALDPASTGRRLLSGQGRRLNGRGGGGFGQGRGGGGFEPGREEGGRGGGGDWGRDNRRERGG